MKHIQRHLPVDSRYINEVDGSITQQRAMHQAVANNDFVLASRLIQSGADIEARDATDLMPLDYCLTMKHKPPDGEEFAMFFVKYLEDIAKSNLKGGRKASCILAYWNTSDLLAKLVEFDRSAAGYSDKYDQCPLHYCFGRDEQVSVDAARVLLAAGADINATNMDGDAPLHLLAAHPLSNDANTHAFIRETIMSLALQDGMSPLHLSSVYGDHNFIEYVFQCGVDINISDLYGFTPLHLAIINVQLKVLETVLQLGVTVDPLNDQGQTPLHYASVLPKSNCTERLLKAGAFVEAEDQFGMRPLHKAAGWGTIEVVRLLILSKAEINVTDKFGQLPIHYSSLKGLADISELLILKGSNVQCFDSSGQTPLHLATVSGKIDIVKLLLLHGADPNSQDNQGQSPLHLACCSGNKEAVRTLINRGASKNIVTVQGQTACMLATDRGFYVVMSILREHRQSLSLYAPEQLKTFEMFRNFTAPTRLDALGQENDGCCVDVRDKQTSKHKLTSRASQISSITELELENALASEVLEEAPSELNFIVGDKPLNIRRDMENNVICKGSRNDNCCNVC